MEVEQALAWRSLRDFIRLGWRWVEPSDYVHGWHIDAICEHLEAVSAGQIRRLIINMPPRHMKSLAVAVFWPAWTWLHDPGHRWLAASYAQSLSVRDSVKCRRLIQSPFFKTLSGRFLAHFRLTGDVNNKVRFENSRGGVRLAASVEGALTGEGGDCLPAEALLVTEDGPLSVGELVRDRRRVRVLSRNDSRVEFSEVIAWQSRPGEELVEVALEDGKILRCTPGHPIWTRNRGYVPAEELTTADECLVLQ